MEFSKILCANKGSLFGLYLFHGLSWNLWKKLKYIYFLSYLSELRLKSSHVFIVAAVNKTQNMNYTMVTNGCGSYGVSINFEKNLTEFNSCCNIHDICYQTCSKTKEICDNTFKNCLTDVCGRYNRTNQLKAKSANFYLKTTLKINNLD